jgi:peptidoglycan/xylan/chitin deacetylase (PgdA/CDA1 family)
MTRMPFAVLILAALASSAVALEPISDKLVVLTFDDASKSHFTIARLILLKYKFGATFFVTEGWDFANNKKDYMTWEEIAGLHKDESEIGNYTKNHQAVTDKAIRELAAKMRGSTIGARSTASINLSASRTRATRSRRRPCRS